MGISKNNFNQSIVSLEAFSARESQLSKRTSLSNYSAQLNEFQDYANVLIAKQEKKIEWCKLFLHQLFEANASIPTFKSMLDEPHIKLSCNDVSLK